MFWEAIDTIFGGPMTAKIVRYHNDFNKVYLGKLNSGELNLMFSIFCRVKDQGTAPIKFTADELKENLPKNYTQHEFTNLMTSLRRKFFKLDFTIIYDYGDGRTDDEIINLFRKLTIHRKNGEVTGVTIQVDEIFQHLLNDLHINWTRFELEELLQIRGAYAKRLYRLLKQYKDTGTMVISLDEFSEQMGIPESYSQGDINKFVLKPAVAELSEERTVNGVTRATFKKLRYKKLTGPGTRTRKITAIQFDFTPENRAQPQPKPGRKAKKAAANAAQVCPYAEGTDLWYVWHHLTPPSTR